MKFNGSFADLDGLDRWPRAEPLALNVLLAEDDPELRSMLALVLRRDGHCVTEVQDGAALADALARRFLAGNDDPRDALVVADVRMPVLDSLTVLSALRSHGRQLRVVLMTAFADAEVQAAASDLDALALLDKPFDFDDLRSLVRYLARWR